MRSEGCRLCRIGAKMVLFVTGLCDRTCWYCPLSKERKNRDVSFANERPVTSQNDIIEEAEVMSALGTGITGGEPLLRLDRVVSFAGLLKEHFGAEHHIHLYTGRAPGAGELEALKGLVDEIRFHPPPDLWADIPRTPYFQAIAMARDMGFSVGIEVPALPGLHHLRQMLPSLDFLNINELEWGETCAAEMRSRGYSPEDGMHNAVQGSKDWAAGLIGDPKVRWCSSVFKDSVQLRERLKRIAHNTARHFDEITEDGTIVYGVLEQDGERSDVPGILREDACMVFGDRIELAWSDLLAHADLLQGRKYIVERYPNGGMIVEVTPL